MEIRDYYFKDKTTVNDSDTTIISLKGTNPITALFIDFEVTNGATSCLNHEIHDDVSLIEVVDGSRVICSLSMHEWLAISSLLLGRIPRAVLSEVGGAIQKERVVILFGRNVNDAEYYFDAGSFKEPELRIANNFTISSSAGFATGSGKISVMAKIIDKGYKAHKGYMMTKEIKSFTSGTSGEEVVAMPTDYPYRFLVLQIIKSTYRPDEVISKVKLTCNNDEFIPVNTYMEDLIDKNMEQFGLFRQEKSIYRADDGTCLTDIYDIRQANIEPRADDHIATVEGVDGEQVSIGLYDMTSPSTPAFQTSSKESRLSVIGNCPFGAVGIGFGDLNNPEELLRADEYEKIDLKLTQQASGTVNVILQQVVS